MSPGLVKLPKPSSYIRRLIRLINQEHRDWWDWLLPLLYIGLINQECMRRRLMRSWLYIYITFPKCCCLRNFVLRYQCVEKISTNRLEIFPTHWYLTMKSLGTRLNHDIIHVIHIIMMVTFSPPPPSLYLKVVISGGIDCHSAPIFSSTCTRSSLLPS